MDVENHHMRSHVARASEVGYEKMFDWELAARRIKEVAPDIAEVGLLEDWPNTGVPIWRGGEPVTHPYAYFASIRYAPILILDGKPEECWRPYRENPGWGEDEAWPTEALAIIEASAGGQADGKDGAVMSGAHPGAQPELTPERFGEYCDYCIESHPAPCRDARESLGRNAVRLLVEDYGEEFVKNLLKSHKV